MILSPRRAFPSQNGRGCDNGDEKTGVHGARNVVQIRCNPIAYIVDTTKEHVLKNNMIDDRLGFQVDNQALKRFITKIRAPF